MSLEDLQVLISPKFSTNNLIAIVKNYSVLDNITLGNICIHPSSQKIGDSYLSKIVRFTLNATGINVRGVEEKVSINVITKVLPPNLGRRKTFRSTDFFENEAIFYDKVWASMKKFYESKNLSEEFGGIIPLFLTSYIDGENDFICLEDLSFKNYESVERGNGIDRVYTMKAMDLFAKFHALSLAFKDQEPEQFLEKAKCLKETYFSKRFYGWYGKFQESLFEVVRDAVKQELPGKYYDKIDPIFKDNLFMKACDICENNHSHLSGITEGDAWIPNFLFRRDEDDHLHVALIDFQLARWAPFCVDVTFFLITCVEEKILVKEWDDFINEYGLKMKKYLSNLGSSSDLFSVVEFKEDIAKNFVCTFCMLVEGFPMSLLEGFDLDLIKGEDAVPLESVWKIHPFEDQFRRKRVASMIKFIVDKGLI